MKITIVFMTFNQVTRCFVKKNVYNVAKLIRIYALNVKKAFIYIKKITAINALVASILKFKQNIAKNVQLIAKYVIKTPAKIAKATSFFLKKVFVYSIAKKVFTKIQSREFV